MNRETARLVSMELRLTNSGRWGGVYFHGPTMLPFLRDGDELVVEPVSWRDVRPGEIITYRSGDRFPTRRVIRCRPRLERFILQADGLSVFRIFRVQQGDVLGRVVARKRGSRVLTNKDFGWRLAGWRALVRANLGHFYRRLRRALRGAGPPQADP